MKKQFGKSFKLREGNFEVLVIGLFAFSLIVNFFVIQIHPFLHDWDERFHALVAKNLTEDFLLPLLYNGSPIPVCDTGWVCNTVWLHKQPLFLWQIALSIKLFGATELSVRLPSAIMLSLTIFPIYKIGTIVFDKKAGLIAALLTVSNWFILEHINGYIGMDHNDVAFMFYVTLSIWALVEYINSPKLKYVVLMGLFAGAAMLCKWLVGTLVFEGFLVYLLLNFKTLKQAQIAHFILAIFIAIIVFLPWQVYTFYKFPNLALHEWQFNQKHFWEVVENHWQPCFFYFSEIKNQFSYLWILIPVGLIFSFFNKTKLLFILPFLVMISSVFLFFTIAATKISSYTMVVMPMLFLFIANSIVGIVNLFKQREKGYCIASLVLISFALFVNLNISKQNDDYNLNRDFWINKLNNAKFLNTQNYKKIKSLNLPLKTAIIGFDNFSEIEGMFYTGHLCYGYYISIELINELKCKGYQIAVFRNRIPETVQSDSSLVIFAMDYN
jgi:4-amino-4-deoxy-L-arabinose transferase-like glycosyltransferase